jgi:N-acyl-phosphatidylethanolamine-hydrolysing phospholipase D
MSIDRARLAQLAGSDNHRHGLYHNIEPTPRHGWREFLRWQREHGWRFPKGQAFAWQRPDSRLLLEPGEAPRLTWIGHASFLFQYQGLNLLTDPVFSERCSPLSFAGPKRYTPAALTVDELPDIQVVLISHNHYDHLDRQSVLDLYRRFGDALTFLVPSGVANWFAKEGIHNVIERGWWQSHQLPQAEAFFVPAQHFSGRSLRDRNASLWGGWWLAFDDFRLYFAGDTGYGGVFSTIHEVLGAPDLALLPIGAYAPRWMMQGVHVDPFDAVQIHCDLEAKQSVAMHWGTFVLTDEPMDEPPLRLRQALAEKHLPQESFAVMRHGESRSIRKSV